MRLYELTNQETNTAIAIGDQYAKGVASVLNIPYKYAASVNNVSSLLDQLGAGKQIILSVGLNDITQNKSIAGTLVTLLNSLVQKARAKQQILVYILFPDTKTNELNAIRNSIKQSLNTFIFDANGAEIDVTGDLSKKSYISLATSIQTNLSRVLQYATPKNNQSPPTTSTQNLSFNSNVNKNINGKLLSLLSRTFSLFGRSFPIISGYRSPSYNRKVDGAKNSAHMRGNAVDIDVSMISKSDRIRLIQLASGVGITGIGVYKNSLHFDIEQRRGWGPTKHWASMPDWALPTMTVHMQNGFARSNI